MRCKIAPGAESPFYMPLLRPKHYKSIKKRFDGSNPAFAPLTYTHYEHICEWRDGLLKSNANLI